MGFVRTVLGDIPTDALGITYTHEHLIIDSEIVEKNFEHIWLPSVHHIPIRSKSRVRRYFFT